MKEANRPGEKHFGLAQEVSNGGGALGAGGSHIELFLKGLIDATNRAMAEVKEFAAPIEAPLLALRRMSVGDAEIRLGRAPRRMSWLREMETYRLFWLILLLLALACIIMAA